MLVVLWHSALVLLVICLAGAWLQYRWQNAGHADVIWTFCTSGVSLYYLIVGSGAFWPRFLTGLLLLAWGWRLGGHILVRVLHEPEDGRYQAMRQELGRRINLFHVFFFLAQGLMAWCFALPAWVIASCPLPVNRWALGAGFVLGCVALLGEYLADRQLSAFRSNPLNRGKTCRAGLWRYSRHPNYFFEWLHWLAYPVIAIGIPDGGWLWLAPLLMFLFLWFVTGIPYTEQQALKSRGEDYRHYQQTTSMFFPWRPKQ